MTPGDAAAGLSGRIPVLITSVTLPNLGADGLTRLWLSTVTSDGRHLGPACVGKWALSLRVTAAVDREWASSGGAG